MQYLTVMLQLNGGLAESGVQIKLGFEAKICHLQFGRWNNKSESMCGAV